MNLFHVALAYQAHIGYAFYYNSCIQIPGFTDPCFYGAEPLDVNLHAPNGDEGARDWLSIEFHRSSFKKSLDKKENICDS